MHDFLSGEFWKIPGTVRYDSVVATHVQRYDMVNYERSDSSWNIDMSPFGDTIS